ncbi:Macrophage erythroblast attacher [Globisporangium polare]
MELNHPLLRVPFEQVNKSFRLYHKQLTKELGIVTKAIADLHEEQQPAQRMDVDALINKLGELTNRIQDLKHDAKQKVAEQQRDLEICLQRAHYIKELEKATPHLDPKKSSSIVDEELKSSTQSSIANRLIADYLLSRGLLDSSKIIQESKGVDFLVDHGLHSECQAILRDLQAHDTSSALAWCAQNASRLRRLQSRLEFRLRLQEFIEFVRSHKQLEAIQYAQMFLTPLAMQREDKDVQRADLEEIEVAMGTLAFKLPEQSGQAHYAKLFAANRWSQLVDDFQKTFFEAYGVHDPPSLCIALYTGLSTLNTRTCQRNRDECAKAKLARKRSSLDSSEQDDVDLDDDEDAANQKDASAEAFAKNKKTKLSAMSSQSDQDSSQGDSTCTHGFKRSDKHLVDSSAIPVCPCCSDLGSQLCAGVPFAYHPHSRVVCRVTHKVMDEHNPPRVLPNGHVYSQEGIEQMLKLNERSGMIKCVETQELFAVSEIKPVYIL